MKVETKFNIGDSVVFLHQNCFTRRTISRIEIEASVQDGKESVLITYRFPNLTDDYSSHTPAYKYENEVATTREELAAQSKEFVE